ncbi:uncharacterized protein LOC134530581 [Bacillus rossius redtenbacheri]|uniref:uncharacterized protein LOC134530581 n=1 Tax=Bacillus rossius redtenbacheri TaxID=93214 RepID=UPI002FDEFABD
MSNPLRSLNENFRYNYCTAKSLMLLFTNKADRDLIQQWLDKLQSIKTGSTETLNNRNSYMWTLVLSMQTNRLIKPFTDSPTSFDLPPLKEVMSAEEYGDILRKTHAGSTGSDVVHPDQKAERRHATVREVAPSEFLSSQPTPRDGSFCYMAVFSDWG